jgi:divalent metal cation (Fe/Co/Zn/Cd) transporter
MTFRRPAADASPDTWMAYARMLAVVTVFYNVIEGLVSMGFGASNESVALFVFSPALWWVDSLAALVLCGFIAKEGVHGILAASRPDFDGGCGCH